LLYLLDAARVEYEVITHNFDSTAIETAADTHTPRLEFAKTIVVEADRKYLLAVLPAHHKIDLDALAKALDLRHVSLVPESLLLKLFPDCAPGTTPPFGAYYHMPVIVAAPMAMDKHITFNAGSHVVAIRMSYADFERLVHPRVVAFSQKLQT
jgi:Ala-tRNA(Pro) deacylase